MKPVVCAGCGHSREAHSTGDACRMVDCHCPRFVTPTPRRRPTVKRQTRARLYVD